MNQVPFHPFCATCLSQGRKMYYVKYYSPPYLDLIRNFMLTENDRICWECHSFVLKMGAFRVKAWRAQNCLVALFNRHPTQLLSLSNLAIEGIFLDIINPQEDQIMPECDAKERDPLDFDDAKTERDEMIHFQVFQHARSCFEEVRERRQVSRVQPGAVMAIGTLPQATTHQIPSTNEIRVPDHSFKIRLPPKPASKTDQQLDTNQTKTKKNARQPEHGDEVRPEPRGPSFTEEILSEEDMAKWREGKRQLKMFSENAPHLRCEKCVQPSFEYNPWWYKHHWKMHTEDFGDLLCEICELRFYDEETMVSHKKSHNRLLKCGFCDVVWDHPNAMRVHCNEQHGVSLTVWTCDICLRNIPLEKKHKHLRSHLTTKCPECNKKIKRHTLSSHMTLHTRGSERRYECECGSKFYSKSCLLVHMKIHSDKIDPNAYCMECNKQYKNMLKYRAHFRSKKHSTDSQLRQLCQECGKRFRTKFQLQSHLSKHSKLKKYVCELCPALFKSKAGYRLHKKSKHDGVVKPKDKICDYCGKAFKARAILTDHINSHTGWRPYKCDTCGDTFGHKSAHYLHVRLKHLKIPRKKVKKTAHK